jgi:DNA-binding transcriptional MerR regulator
LDQHFYHTSQFAQKAAVSVRTLRYYDKEGILSPSGYTEAGYRLYTDADFFRLQQILALKFLGFSLDEIKVCLQTGPGALQESLSLQKAMMQEKKQQLESIIQAIDETEKLLRINKDDWQAVISVIQVMQMQQSNDWRKKYFSEEQLQQMEELSKRHYTEEQRQKLAEWGKNFTEEDQNVATQQWNEVFAELNRLMTAGADPASPKAQALAKRWVGLIEGFTHGDSGITQGLSSMYKELSGTPAEQIPFPLPSFNKDAVAFIQAAIKVHNENKSV